MAGEEPGFWSGLQGSQSQGIAQQGDQLNQALAIAHTVMQQRAQEHAQQMADIAAKHQEAQANYWQENADTQKQYRQEQQKTAAQREQDQAIAKALDFGKASMDVGGQGFDVAYGRLKKLDPDTYDALRMGGYAAAKMKWHAEHPDQQWPTSSAPSPPSTTPSQTGAGAPMPAQGPSPADNGMQAGMGAMGSALGGPMGMALASAGRGMPQVAPQPAAQPQPTPAGLPMRSMPQAAPQGPMPTSMPQQGVPVGAISQAPQAMPHEPTIEEWAAQQGTSPAYAESIRRTQAKETNLTLLAKVKADAAAAQATRSAALAARAKADLERADTDKKAFEGELGKYANSAALLTRKYDQAKDVLAETKRWHDMTDKIADRRATTYESNVQSQIRARVTAPTHTILDKMDAHVQRATKMADDLETAAQSAEDARLTQVVAEEKAHGMATDNADNVALARIAAAETAKTQAIQNKRDVLFKQADDARTALTALKNTRDNMQKDAVAKGITTYSDGGDAGPQTRLPKRPASAGISASPARRYGSFGGKTGWFHVVGGKWVPE